MTEGDFDTALQNLIGLHEQGWRISDYTAEVQALEYPDVDPDALWQAFEDWRIANGLPTHEPIPAPSSELRETVLAIRRHTEA